MKYKELDSIQRSNYWSLISLIDIFHTELGEHHPRVPEFFESMRILETNLNIELFTYMERTNESN